MKLNIDYRLYLVTDPHLFSTNTLTEAIEQAIEGGVTLVQLREKELDSGPFYEEALEIKQLTKSQNIPLIINDRVDIALACDADGIHIGQSDLPIEIVRKLIGKDKIIGVSVQTLQEAIEAENGGADYLGIGAMFPTTTKEDAIQVTNDELKKICQKVSIPIVLIGGINQQTIPYFKDFPIQGFAVVSAILAKNKIKEASQELLRLINQTISS
ncbi:thiamine phosphate synthase [Enterococcus faecium]|uniref:thiamine phosphate synthase n=1 Tax=Enterococcus TaxID=1350 RepID=UPI0021AFDB71|nr:thiamine phosphate synthase [Enterococcus faecium]MCS8592338.1 thiamine phosphate synthase [Enterococcus faecium]